MNNVAQLLLESICPIFATPYGSARVAPAASGAANRFNYFTTREVTRAVRSGSNRPSIVSAAQGGSVEHRAVNCRFERLHVDRAHRALEHHQLRLFAVDLAEVLVLK